MPSSNKRRQSRDTYERQTEAQKQETRARTATEDVSRKQREAQCLQLRIQGWSFERIAHEVGYANSGGAYKAWKRALADIPKVAADDAREHLRLQLEDVTAHLYAMLTRAPARDAVRAGEAIVKAHERYCRMLNLDIAPDTAAGAQLTLIPIAADVLEAV